MIPVPGFIVGGYPNGPPAPDRAFVLTDAAPDTFGRVDMGSLKSDYKFRHVPRARRRIHGLTVGNCNALAGVCQNGTDHLVRSAVDADIIIPRFIPARDQRFSVETNSESAGCRYLQYRYVDAREDFPCRNCFGTDRAVLLAYDTGRVHGEG